jgi:hypothetical protein
MAMVCECGAVGVRFRMIANGQWKCVKCIEGPQTRDTAKNNFAFSTMHLGQDPTKGPIEVQNMRHLSRLEREHGVVSVALNYDHKNQEPPQQETGEAWLRKVADR